jgi:hypothetical protein
MATQTLSPARLDTEVRDSWVPMIVIAMGQMLMSFNVAAIPVSMGGMVESFNTPPTTVGHGSDADVVQRRRHPRVDGRDGREL